MQPAKSGEEPATVRGSNFSPLEDLALARCFLRASNCVTDMDAEQMWDKVATLYAAQPEAGVPRTAHSLRCRWSPLQRAAQKYIAADKLYRAAIPSGQSEADVVTNVQELYRRSNQTKGKLAPAFKSTDAAALLATSPKFSGEGAEESACAGGRQAVSASGGPASVEGSSAAGGTDDSPLARSAELQDSPRPSPPVHVTAAVPARRPSEHRPEGAKRQKKASEHAKGGAAVAELAHSCAQIKDALQASSARRTRLAAMALEANLVSTLPEGNEKSQLVRDLQQRTRSVEQAESTAGCGSVEEGASDRGTGGGGKSPRGTNAPGEAGDE